MIVLLYLWTVAGLAEGVATRYRCVEAADA